MRDKIFISYRRDDARHPAARIYERLARRFGKTRVFMDVDTIRRGFDFRQVLRDHLAETKVMLVVIGPAWADLADESGRRRLDDPSDFVRMEIAEALKSAAAVIPVLVDGAVLPRADQLPEDIADLRFRQSVELRPDDFAHDVGLLEKSVAKILRRREGAVARWAAAGVGVIGLGAAAIFTLNSEPDAPPALGEGTETTPAEPRTVASDERETPLPVAQSPDRDAWLAVRESEDVGAIAGFLRSHPNSGYADAAAARLDALLRAEMAGLAARDDASTVAQQAMKYQDDFADLEARLPAFSAAADRALREAVARLAAAYDVDGLAAAAANSFGRVEAAGLPEAIRQVEAGLREAQAELARLGLYEGAQDGIWGRNSAAALRRFEEATGREVDGALSAQDLAALKAASRLDLIADLTTFRDCDACPEMVVLPAGAFTMGAPASEADSADDERPQHRVTVQRFAIGRTEVTFDQWAACVADGYCQSNRSPENFDGATGAHPVRRVSWEDITRERGFIDWMNSKVEGAPYRLPSEAEWEYAARAGTETRFSFGNSDTALGDYAWYLENSGSRTHPVGEKQPNAFGLYDMHGNVYEWVQDCWRDSYNGAPSDGSAWMNANEGDCSIAVLRGGSWSYNPFGLRSASRFWSRRYDRYYFIGFRLARTLRE